MPEQQVAPATIEKPCPGCRGQGQFEYYAKMLDCGRCAGTGRVVCDVCQCCGSHLHERSLTRDEQLRADSGANDQASHVLYGADETP